MTEIEKRLEEIKKDLELDGSLGTEPYHLGYIAWLITQLERALKREAALVAFVESVAIYDLPSEESKTNHMVAWCSMGAAARECLSKVKTK